VYPYEGPNSTINGAVDVYRTNATSDYDALQLQYQRRLAHGLQALATYTWSHAIDELSDDGFFLGQSSRGNSNFDIRQSFSAALSYEVPSWSVNKMTRSLVQGWGLDTIIHVQTAVPINLQAADAFFTPTGQSFAVRPDIVPGVPQYLYGNHCPSLDLTIPDGEPCPGGRRLNPAAFANPPEPQPPSPPTTFRQGTLGRNVLRGFGLSQVDFAFRRDFKLPERLSLQFRAEAFNVFNHPNFGGVSPSTGSELFGWAQSMFGGDYRELSSQYQVGGPRSLQLSLRISF
jgi:hypothetical protein